MIKIKQIAMTGTGEDMCNIPVDEVYGNGYHIMAYCKDVTGGIINTAPSQPNLLVSHKNSIYMSGYWNIDGGSTGGTQLIWQKLNLGDGMDILTTSTTTTTTSTTTTTTTSTRPIMYVVSGLIGATIYNASVSIVDGRGITQFIRDIEVNLVTNPSNGRVTSFTLTTPTNIASTASSEVYVRITGTSTLNGNTIVAGQVQLPLITSWTYDTANRAYRCNTTFSSSIVTTSPEPSNYTYQITLKTGSVEMDTLLVTVTNPAVASSRTTATKIAYNQWAVTFNSPSKVLTNWTLSASGTDINRNDRSGSVSSITFTQNGSYLQNTNVSINMTLNYIINPGGDLTVAPRSLRDREPEDDTNSLDEVINDYLNEE